MGKVESYMVVATPSIFELAENVEVAIKKGWQPLGAVTALPRSADDKSEYRTGDVRGEVPVRMNHFAQAMVKYEKTPTDPPGD